ncbi:hypothetical protein H4F18_00445 [Vibrio scophthalmi]|uniref:hypothetical protein n=1 Tax=Vibrio scophthalmi TaxID=45658 RepID=UPI002FF15896
MKTYNDSYSFKSLATLHIETNVSLKKDSEYLFNVDVEIFDHCVPTTRETIRVFHSSFTETVNKKKLLSGSAQCGIQQRVIAHVAEFAAIAILEDFVTFDSQSFCDFINDTIYFFRFDAQGDSLSCFNMIDIETYCFEKELEQQDYLCSTVKEFAIKYDLVYPYKGRLTCESSKIASIFNLKADTIRKYFSGTIQESQHIRKLVSMTDALLSNSRDEANKINAIIHQ